jgi:hypothetical protein
MVTTDGSGEEFPQSGDDEYFSTLRKSSEYQQNVGLGCLKISNDIIDRPGIAAPLRVPILVRREYTV